LTVLLGPAPINILGSKPEITAYAKSCQKEVADGMESLMTKVQEKLPLFYIKCYHT
jgi:hypothetical protein